MNINRGPDVSDEQEFLKKIEEAARKGTRKGRRGILSFLFQLFPVFLLIGFFVMFVQPKIDYMGAALTSLIRFSPGAEENDLVLQNRGLFGYTAANFEEAILGDSDKLKKLEVYEQDISDVSTVTETGFINWGIFTKNQLITYNGTAVYTVDLRTLSADDIVFDDAEHIVILKIPHAVQEEINIPEDEIQFGDTNGGLLAFGDIKMTAEQASQVQSGAREKMEERLKEDNVQATADRFAKLTVWEMYSPIVKSVARDYSLEVEFR